MLDDIHGSLPGGGISSSWQRSRALNASRGPMMVRFAQPTLRARESEPGAERARGTTMDTATHVILISLAAVLTAGARAQPSQPPPLPPGFVRLSDVAPGIRQDMRYARTFNFMGRAVPGYVAPQCILLGPAAMALTQAEAQLEADGF